MQSNVNPKRFSKRVDVFGKILLDAVDIALLDTLGESGLKAVKFYVDTSLVLKDPGKFQEALRSLFAGSEAAPKLVEDKILRNLADSLRECYFVVIPVDEWKKTFRQFILTCKRLFEVSKF